VDVAARDTVVVAIRMCAMQRASEGRHVKIPWGVIQLSVQRSKTRRARDMTSSLSLPEERAGQC